MILAMPSWTLELTECETGFSWRAAVAAAMECARGIGVTRQAHSLALARLESACEALSGTLIVGPK